MTLRGHITPVLTGHAMVLPEMDFETYSEAGYRWDEAAGRYKPPIGASKGKYGLGVVGLENYARHPTTEILMLAYDLKDGRGPRQWWQGLPPPQELFDWIAAGGLIEAHNASFEERLWRHVAHARMGWPELPPAQLRCSAAKARAACYPGQLALAGYAMGARQQKDPAGTDLIKVFSVPQQPTKANGKTTRYTAQTHPTQWMQFLRYNVIDIIAEAEVSQLAPDLEGEELEWWQVDQEINRRGVQMNLDLVRHGQVLIAQAHERYNGEFVALTGIESPSKLEQFKKWLTGQGIQLGDSLDEDAVDELLDTLHTDRVIVRRALELRGLTGSASVKKVNTINLRTASDGRLRDMYVWHGARTGRPTGEGAQPTNLPQGSLPVAECAACKRWQKPARMRCFWCGADGTVGKAQAWEDIGWKAVPDVTTVIAQRSLSLVEEAFGHAMLALASSLRSAFIAAPGHDLLSSDYSSIEAVGAAMLSGEQWRIDVFRTHGKIYEMSASKITGVPFEDMMAMRGYDMSQPEWWNQKVSGPHHPTRKKLGKVAELASGYQGWIGSWKAFGADEHLSDDEIKKGILAWRAASPAIVHLWGGQEIQIGPARWDRVPGLFGLEGMFLMAFQSPGMQCPVMRLDGTFSGVTYWSDGRAVFCKLPSGRHITYHNVILGPAKEGRYGHSITFEGFNTNPKNGAKGWVRMGTWGGRLMENVDQAICHDILRAAILRLRKFGYDTVMHTYDEIICEVLKGWGSVEELEAHMVHKEPGCWYQDWPLAAAGGWRGAYYRKG